MFAVDTNTERSIAHNDPRGYVIIYTLGGNYTVMLGLTTIKAIMLCLETSSMPSEYSSTNGSLVKTYYMASKLIGEILEVLIDQHGTFLPASYSGMCLCYPSTGLVSCLEGPSSSTTDNGNIMIQTSSGWIHV
jgi:hypothetical protein